MRRTRQFRTDHGLSVSQAANILNVTPKTIRRYEMEKGAAQYRSLDPAARRIMDIIDTFDLDAGRPPVSDRCARMDTAGFVAAAARLGATDAERARVLGLPKSTYSQWASGTYQPSQQASKLIAVLEMARGKGRAALRH